MKSPKQIIALYAVTFVVLAFFTFTVDDDDALWSSLIWCVMIGVVMALSARFYIRRLKSESTVPPD